LAGVELWRIMSRYRLSQSNRRWRCRTGSISVMNMAAAKRAYWKGYLRLSLVSIGVEIFSAAQSRRVALHQFHKPSGKRVRYQKIVPNIGPVDSDDIVKGFELDDDNYVLLEPEELDQIKLESKRTIDLVQFVDHDDIDPRYYDRPFYMVPDSEYSNEGFLVINRALTESRKIGLGQLVLRGQEQLVAVKPCGRGLLLETLRYADEVRASDTFFDDIPEMKLDSEMIGLAKELIERKSSRFNPEDFSDHYAEALQDLVEEKRKGKAVISAGEDERPRTGQVVDLMEALKKSLKNGKGKARKPAAKGASAKPRKAS
jgi:DNA end-binding protein Ku